jgi:hypothetical protein
MFLSCSLFKPLRDEVYTILSQRNSYSYREGYNLYVKSVQDQRQFENVSLGKKVEIYYDEMMILKKMDENTWEIKPEQVKYTEGPKTLYIFHKDPLANILGIFGSGLVATKISRIIASVTREMNKEEYISEVLRSLKFKLKEKEEAINKLEEFTETVEVRVSDIRDPYIADAWLKGTEVDRSDEYEKLIRDPMIGGKVEYMAINYRDKTYYLFSDGRLFTRQASDDALQEIYPIFDITRKLFEVGAVQF